MPSMNEPDRDITYILHWGDLTDSVRMLVAAKTIRAAHKRDRIVLLTTPEFESFLKHCPFFNAVETDVQPETRPAQQLRDKRLKSAKVTRVYDLVGSSESRKLKRALKVKRDMWIDVQTDPRSGQHPIDELAGRIGAITGLGDSVYKLGAAPAPDASWVDYLAKQSRMLDPAYFGLNGPFALLAPSGEGVKPAHRWPKERWASLSHELIQAGITPALIGGPDTREVGRYVAHVTPGATDITGKAKLTQLAGLARHARFVFTEETPLMHLLVAAGPPALVLYSSDEDPVLRAPRSEAPVILMHTPTLAAVSPTEAMAAMKFAGGFESRSTAG